MHCTIIKTKFLSEQPLAWWYSRLKCVFGEAVWQKVMWNWPEMSTKEFLVQIYNAWWSGRRPIGHRRLVLVRDGDRWMGRLGTGIWLVLVDGFSTENKQQIEMICYEFACWKIHIVAVLSWGKAIFCSDWLLTALFSQSFFFNNIFKGIFKRIKILHNSF